ncbi:MAG: hypothetical protein JST82_15840 [Bacteroidetes bacterium]|nr:hypothetical protein [Bacteroidota bacterium]
MEKLLRIILLLVLTTSVVRAQPGQGGRRMERIHAIKVAYITDKIGLSEEQAQRFWPVYNRYEEEKMSIRRQYMQNRRVDNSKMNDEESMRSIDGDIELQEKMLDVRKHYKDEFLKIITPQQLSALIEAEKGFKQMLLRQLKEHRESKGGWR